jgi:hypothetical protein
MGKEKDIVEVDFNKAIETSKKLVLEHQDFFRQETAKDYGLQAFKKACAAEFELGSIHQIEKQSELLIAESRSEADEIQALELKIKEGDHSVDTRDLLKQRKHANEARFSIIGQNDETIASIKGSAQKYVREASILLARAGHASTFTIQYDEVKVEPEKKEADPDDMSALEETPAPTEETPKE